MVESERLIVVYDLGSENVKGLDESTKNMVRSIRVTSIRLLHSLGIMCTQSVIIVSPNNISRVNEVISRVRELYDRIDDDRIKPIIKVLGISESQQTELLEFSKRLLQDRVDSEIDRISDLIDELSTIDDDNVLRRYRYNLSRVKRELERLYNNARELGLEIRDFRYLLDLYDRAIDLTYSRSSTGGRLW